MSSKDNGSKGSRVGGRMVPAKAPGTAAGNERPVPEIPGVAGVPPRLPAVPPGVSPLRPLQQKLFKTDLAESYTRIQLAIKALPTNVEDAEWRSSIDVHNSLLPHKQEQRLKAESEILPLPWLSTEAGRDERKP